MKQKTYLRRLLADLGKQPIWLILASLGTILQVLLTVYIPILIGQAVDLVVLPDAAHLLLPLILQMGLVILFASLIQWLNPLVYNQLIYRYSKSLREKVIRKVHVLPLSYLDRQGTGDLVSRLTTDVEQLNNGLLMVFNQFFVGLLTILVTIASMARLDLMMMGMVLILTPLSLFIARFIAKRSYHLFRMQTQARGAQPQMIEESLSQESLLQAFNAQNQFKDKFIEINGDYAGYSQEAIFYSSTVNPATRFVNALIYALVTGFGAFRILSGTGFTVGQLVTFLNYVNQYTKPFNDISSVLAGIAYGISMMAVALSPSIPLLALSALFSGYTYSTALTMVFQILSAKIPARRLNQVTSVAVLGCSFGAAITPFALNTIGLISDSNAFIFTVLGIAMALLAFSLLYLLKDHHE
jgi:ATP-binding cassette, subfamily B, multidrug efflux pump